MVWDYSAVGYGGKTERELCVRGMLTPKRLSGCAGSQFNLVGPAAEVNSERVIGNRALTSSRANGEPLLPGDVGFRSDFAPSVIIDDVWRPSEFRQCG